jgi:hypothetical protein
MVYSWLSPRETSAVPVVPELVEGSGVEGTGTVNKISIFKFFFDRIIGILDDRIHN